MKEETIMTISRDTQEKMKSFAREQAESYLSEAEMTYMEKLRRKAGQAKGKIDARLMRFKNSSERSREAQDDMIIYMNDYMNDLISQGMSEADAFNKAKEDLTFASKSEQSADLHERFQQYYALRDPSEYEIIGLLYGGFSILGVAVGGLIGILSGGGITKFLENGWINVLIGVGAGAMIGVGLAQICNAIIVAIMRK